MCTFLQVIFFWEGIRQNTNIFAICEWKVQYVEPTYKFPISIGASGEMALSVNDSRKLLVKLVGTERVLDRQQLTTYFRSILMTKVKSYMAQTMRANAINIFEIDESLETFSADIKERLIPDFLDYGVDLKRFYVTTIVKPDGDPQYEKFKVPWFSCCTHRHCICNHSDSCICGIHVCADASYMERNRGMLHYRRRFCRVHDFL